MGGEFFGKGWDELSNFLVVSYLEDVLVTATCKLNQDMWYYSSRGPGQYFGSAGTNQKPDVTAPTPENGLIVYGDEVKILSNGWGTSGACPQSAGLAALLLARDSSLDRDTLFQRIRNSAMDLGHGVHCQGAGLIDCQSAFR
ncbi:MAG: S8 family serine peptidase [Magnetococcales bacterium]|nr:S8 family serine peptidase [Magnetococcales bacterium]